MSLIQPLDIYQTQLRSNQFTSKVRFVKRLVNYIENMPLTWANGNQFHLSQSVW